jgi:hypothetical protein
MRVSARFYYRSYSVPSDADDRRWDGGIPDKISEERSAADAATPREQMALLRRRPRARTAAWPVG